MKLAIVRYGAAVFHQLAEQGAEQKNREELHDEARGAPHEGLRPVGEQRLTGQSCRERSAAAGASRRMLQPR